MPMYSEHCDDYINDPDQPKVLRDWLTWARSPAHGMTQPEDSWPSLYADYKGKRVRVTMASRFGDVGIVYDHKKDSGYNARVLLRDLSNFKDKP